MSFITLDHAIAAKFTIDQSCYPWVAYKGKRFNPTEWHYTDTQTERDLKEELSTLKYKISMLYGCACGVPEGETDEM